MKICCSCKQTKPVTEFWRNVTAHDGRQTICKACRYVPKNLAKHQEAMRRHQSSFGFKMRRKPRIESESSKQKRAEKQLQYKKTESFKFQQKRYRESAKGRFGQLRCQSKKRGKEVSLTLEQFAHLIAQPCHYCGSALTPTGIGLDRKDNAVGYYLNNVVSCCGECNATRGITWSHEEMLVIGRTVARLKSARQGSTLPQPMKLCEYARPK